MASWKSWRLVPAVAAASWVVLAGACDDPFGPLEWDATPDTASIWSASRLELVEQPAAFDFALGGTPVWIEFSGGANSWDVVLIDHEGGLALAPSSYFEGQSSRAGIAVRPNTALDEITRAPSDSASYRRTPVPLAAGTVYIIRSRTAICESQFSSGPRYAKIRPVTIDAAAGSFTFEMVRNPYCSQRSFIPPDGND
jgi:hypothetical protein